VTAVELRILVTAMACPRIDSFMLIREGVSAMQLKQAEAYLKAAGVELPFASKEKKGKKKKKRRKKDKKSKR
jgi:hypothetical protein